MIKISIVGAPGSGKSAFSRDLASALRTQDKKDKKVNKVDGYINDLTKKTGYEYGISATYPQNMQILFQRQTREQEAEHKGCDVLITCGSIYETILYTAFRGNIDLVLEKQKGIPLEARVIMESMGAIHSMTITSDIILFLPYTKKMISNKGSSYDVEVDNKLPEVLEEFFRPMTTLRGTLKEKTEYALNTIKAYEKRKAEVPPVVD